jgi:hypothetical protein
MSQTVWCVAKIFVYKAFRLCALRLGPGVQGRGEGTGGLRRGLVAGSRAPLPSRAPGRRSVARGAPAAGTPHDRPAWRGGSWLA